MALAAGTRFGPYEVLSALGAGGIRCDWRHERAIPDPRRRRAVRRAVDDITGDGKRFVIETIIEADTPRPMTIVVNFAQKR
jgi:hypothetical protein